MKLGYFLSAEDFPNIKPPLVLLINKEKDIQDKNPMKIILYFAPNNSASDHYEFNTVTLGFGSPEYSYRYSKTLTRQPSRPEPCT